MLFLLIALKLKCPFKSSKHRVSYLQVWNAYFLGVISVLNYKFVGGKLSFVVQLFSL